MFYALTFLVYSTSGFWFLFSVTAS